MKRVNAAIVAATLAIIILAISLLSAYAATPEKPMLELIDKGSGVYDLMLNEDTPKITTFQIAVNGTVSEDFEVRMPDADWLIIGGAKSITTGKTTWAMGNLTAGGAVYPAGKIATILAAAPLSIDYDGKSHTAMEIATPGGYEKLLFGVVLRENAIAIKAGENAALEALLLPNDASNKTITWSSSNTSVATVDESGRITALADGTAVITATTAQGGHTATAALTVAPIVYPVTGVTLDENVVTLVKGKTQQLAASITPGNATNKTVAWHTSNAEIASVSNTGLITAIKEGQATITVTTEDGGFTANCAVTVTASETPDPTPTDPTDALPIHTIKPVLPTAGVPENIICVKPKAEYVPETATSADRAAALQQAADKMVYTNPQDLVIDGLGYITGTAAMLAAGHNEVVSADILGLPVVTAPVNIGDILSGGFEMEGGHLKATKPEEIRLMAYTANHSAVALKYAKSEQEFAEGTFTLMDRWNRFVYGKIDPYQVYRVVFFIKDGGPYDLDGRTDGSVTALTAIFPQNTVSPPPSDDHNPGGGGGGGCNSGAGAALLLPILYVVFQKFSRKKV